MNLNACSSSRSFSVYLRKAVKRFLFLHPRLVFTKDVTNSMLSLLSCVSFVWGSYLDDDTSEIAAERVAALDLFELGACIFFALDYVLLIILAPNKLTHIMSGTALLDFITTFPQLLMFLILAFELSSKEIEYTAKLNFLRFIRVLKILRLEKINRNVVENPETFARTIVSTSVTKLVLTVITIVFCFSGIFGAVESTFGDPVKLAHSKQGKLDFLNCVYFILSTMSTVGFGDIVPVSVAGKLVFVVLIFVTFIVVARQLDQLTSLLKSQSKYSRDSYNQLSKHVIVCGDVSHDTLKVFLEEFMHKDHNTSDIRVVVLVNSDPDWEMQRLLENAAFSGVKYIRGSPTQNSDLSRCKLSTASCVFILNDPQSIRVLDSDNQCILRALSVYALFEPNSDQLLILQLHSMLSKRRYLSIASPKQNVHIICWEELRPSILSACCDNPCFGIFLFNWIKSFNYSDSSIMKQQLQGWQTEYIAGKGFEIYTACLNGYAKSSFHAVSAFLYMKFGVFVIAIGKDNNDTSLAPLGFVFGESPVKVYLLAEDASIVKQLQQFKPGSNHNWRSFEENFMDGDEFIYAERAPRESRIQASTKSNSNSVFKSLVKKSATVAKAAKGFADIFRSTSTAASVVEAPKIVSRNWTILRRAVTVGAVLKAGLKSSTRLSKEQYAFLLESELNPKYNRLSSQLYFHVSPDQNSTAVNCGINGRFEGHGHIIYCCRQVVGMRRFIAPLRSKHRAHVVPVVILCASISQKELANIAIFPSVFVIVGNVLDPVNLLRASVTTARVAVICMSQKESSSQATVNEDVTIDADVIFAYNLIKRLNSSCALVSEVGLLENLKYLKEQSTLKGSRDLGDLFASGTIFPHAFFTTLTCQCFFNPILPQLIIELLRPSPIDSLASREHPSVLVTFPAPSQFWGRSLAEVYPTLCQKGIVLLGIIRAPNKRLGNVLPFAYACPSSISIIHAGDALQTLSSHNHDVILQKFKVSSLHAQSSNQSDSEASESFLSHDSEKLLVDLVSKLAAEVKGIRGMIRK